MFFFPSLKKNDKKGNILFHYLNEDYNVLIISMKKYLTCQQEIHKIN